MKKEQIIFLHIPKTAGTTLRNIIYAQYGEARTAPIYEEESSFFSKEQFKQLIDTRKDQADVIIGHIEYGFHQLLAGNRPYRYAALLRDPIKCCLSLYNHFKNVHYSGSDISLLELIKGPHGGHFINLQTRIICGINDFNAAIDTIDREFALIGITERFNETLLLASHILGWRMIPYKRLNISTQWKINYIEELKNDKRAMDLLIDMNEIDIRLYEYVNSRLTERLNKLYPDFQERLMEYEAIITSPETVEPKAIGNLGLLQKRRIIGWGKLLNNETPAEIGITINGTKEFHVYANVRRDDLTDLHYTGNCGFVLNLPQEYWLKQGDEVNARVINASNTPLQFSPRVFYEF